jgi:hypothetical protein
MGVTDAMGEVGVVGVAVGAVGATVGVLALGEGGDSTVAEEGVVATVLLETNIVNLLQVLHVHGLRETGVLANHFDGVAVGLPFVAGLLGLR